jgi:hypothetical protein
MELYRAFRGGEPSIDALLERDGITKKWSNHWYKKSTQRCVLFCWVSIERIISVRCTLPVLCAEQS